MTDPNPQQLQESRLDAERLPVLPIIPLLMVLHLETCTWRWKQVADAVSLETVLVGEAAGCRRCRQAIAPVADGAAVGELSEVHMEIEACWG
jgi:hypothetical protein